MDPITLGLTAVSIASSIFGATQQTRGARQQAASQRAITGLEMRVEAQRMKAMELDARRRQLEIIRQGQRARAMALTIGTGQGVSQGSSVFGGAFGQIAGQTRSNLAGIEENLGIGREMFGLNQQIGQQRIQAASAGSTIATGQGFSSLGSSLMQAAPQITSGIRSLPGLFSSGISPIGSSFSNSLGPR